MGRDWEGSRHDRPCAHRLWFGPLCLPRTRARCQWCVSTSCFTTCRRSHPDTTLIPLLPSRSPRSAFCKFLCLSGCVLPFPSPPYASHTTEIKLIVMSLIARATPTLLEGKFEVADPLNTVRLSFVWCSDILSGCLRLPGTHVSPVSFSSALRLTRLVRSHIGTTLNFTHVYR